MRDMAVFLIEVLGSWLLLVALHLGAMAAVGSAFGVTLREISFGFGDKVLFRRGLLKVRAVPFGGFVKFRDTREEGVEEAPAAIADAYNHQPKLVQALIPLAGSLALVLLAVSVQPDAGLDAVVAGFGQIFAGALAPLSTAQEYLQRTYTVAVEQGFIALLGLLAAKIAAFNLLPFPSMNGGQAILALLRADRTTTPRWQERLLPISMLPLLALFAMWLYAFGAFLYQ